MGAPPGRWAAKRARRSLAGQRLGWEGGCHGGGQRSRRWGERWGIRSGEQAPLGGAGEPLEGARAHAPVPPKDAPSASPLPTESGGPVHTLRALRTSVSARLPAATHARTRVRGLCAWPGAERVKGCPPRTRGEPELLRVARPSGPWGAFGSVAFPRRSPPVGPLGTKRGGKPVCKRGKFE